MDITVVIPDNNLDSFVYQYRYQDTIDGEPNPQSKSDFAAQTVQNFCNESILAYVGNQAAEQARVAAIQTVTEILPTSPPVITTP